MRTAAMALGVPEVAAVCAQGLGTPHMAHMAPPNTAPNGTGGKEHTPAAPATTKTHDQLAGGVTLGQELRGWCVSGACG